MCQKGVFMAQWGVNGGSVGLHWPQLESLGAL